MKKLLLSVLTALLFVSVNLNGQAIAFDGDQDFIDLGNDPSLHITGTAITLESWIFITEFQGNGDAGNFWAGVILSTATDGEPTGAADGYMLRAGGNGEVDFNIGPLGPEIWQSAASPENTLELNTWYHIAGVYDGANMILYVDGAEVARLAGDWEVGPAPTTPVYIGEDPTWRGRTFEGLIDEVRIWNVARTPAEIFENRDKELCIADQSGLVSYYKFNENTGLTAADESGLNNGVFGASADSTDYHPTWIANGPTDLVTADCGGINATSEFVANNIALGQSFPNPATGITAIPYIVEESGFVSIKVFNLLGEEVYSVLESHKFIGEYTATFNTNDLTKGVYFYNMSVNDELVDSKKMIVN